MSETLEVLGSIAGTGLLAAALLARERRLRASLMIGGLAIAAALVAGQGRDEAEALSFAPLAAGVAGGAAVLVALGLLLYRLPLVLPVLLVAALPFRIPIDVGGEEANLLLPLYAVIGAGALAFALDALRRDREPPPPPPKPLAAAIAAATVLYAVQAAYTNDVAFAARNVAFFLIPFAAMFVLLTEVRWTPRVLAAALGVIAAEAAIFSLVGIGQFVTAEIFWNPALERSNDFHLYFRVNSLFWDPNVYGRYLALALVLLATVLVWTRRPARMAGLALLGALVFAGLLFSFSQTSFIALLAGITVLCALRYSLLWTAVATPFAIAAAVAAVLVVGGTSEAEDDPQEISSGRSGLIEGGIDLARTKPLAGHGSASFPLAFREQEDLATGRPAISHNEPVTVAAEQGAAGLAAYIALLAAATWTLLGGMRRLAPGFGAPRDAVGDPFEDPDSIRGVARIGLVVAFGTLVIHTIGYAGYLTDPLTWALLAVGGALAAGARSARAEPPARQGAGEPARQRVRG
ncbi:MAG: O-antigen ligase family protein [Solirubrobacterales bacterium]